MKTFKQTLVLFLFSIASCLYGQDLKPQYKKGAVTEVDGKVIFNRSVKTNIPDDKLFALMDKWLKDRYADKNQIRNRVALSDPVEKEIACIGETAIIFKSSALSLDRTFMTYQLLVDINNGTCDMTFRNLKYRYQESNKEELYVAEEMITDKVALNKNGTKLNRFYDKFRTHTIDSINSFFNSVEVYLNGKPATHGASSQVALQAAVPVISSPIEAVSQVETATNNNDDASLPGYRRIDADKIPGNIIKLLNDWTLITSGNTNVNTMTASWGGLGKLWEQPVAFCFINPTRYSISTMDEGDVYTISFYTEAYKDALRYCGSHSGRDGDKIKASGLTPLKTPSGATAFSEAWMIVECKKILAQPISADAVVDKDIAKQWSKDGYHKIYVGQILNVWVK